VGITVESTAQLTAHGLRVESIDSDPFGSTRSSLDINDAAIVDLSDVRLRVARKGLDICDYPTNSPKPCKVQATMERAVIESMAASGIEVTSDQGTHHTFSDVLLDRSSDIGLVARGDAQVTLQRAAIRGFASVGICIFEGNTVEGTDVLLTGSIRQQTSSCHPSFVSIPVQGAGAIAFSRSTLTLDRFLVSTSSTGIRGVGADAIDLARGWVRNNRYGVHTVSEDQWFAHIHHVVFTSTVGSQIDLVNDQ
jgi:hypothetical protein